MSQLLLSNVISISVAQAQRGIGAYNTSNLALITTEQPLSAFTDGYKIYLEASEVATDFGSSTDTAALAATVFSQSPNILTGGGYLVVIPRTGSGTEDIDDAITRMKDVVQFFGIITDVVMDETAVKASAAVVQPLNKMIFSGQNVATVVDTSDLCQDIMDAGYDKTRMLLYISADSFDAANFAAAYASRALSTNFSGSNTTQTMHMKDLVGIDADEGISQTIFNKCKTVGADCYPSFQGVPKTFSTGANGFFDQVYNRCWLVGALEVAGFNYLATTSTKIPQSEDGISGLKGAYRAVLEQAITNQYAAPGRWNSADTFGNLEDFHRNIIERGYYMYSLPVNQQLQVDREARKAPLIRIAIKEAGAVHSSDVIVNINA